jgi:hypothetical protein
MKLIYTFTIAFFISLNLFSQTPGWQWAIGAGTPGNDESGSAITTDASGNIYSIGVFGSNTLTIGTASVVRSGGGNTYVVKQDASGNVIWARSYSFSPPTLFGINSGKAICVDGSGNVYITGYYTTSMVLGTTTLTSTDSSSTVVGDIYVAKLNSSGTVQWAKSAGGAVADIPNGIAVDASGNVFVTGLFRSRYLRFGSSATLFNQYATSSNFWTSTDLFVAKYDGSGNFVWAKNTSSSGGGNAANGICTDASGNVIITGTYYLPNVVFGTNTLTATSAINLFVTKYDNSGNVIWAKTAAGAGSGSINHYAYGVASDAGGNIYMAGGFNASTLTIGSVVLNTLGNSDLLVAKFDPSGNALWAKNAGGSSTGVTATGIVATAGGESYVTGYFTGLSPSFGTVSVTNVNSGGNNNDVFVAKYNSSGTINWAAGAGGQYDDQSNSITVDGGGNAIITGYTKCPTIAFGSLTVTASTGYQDIFIAKMGTMSGIKEFSNVKDQLHIYPNPGTGVFNFKTSTELSKIEIVNMLGEIIYSSNTTISQIDISSQPKGIYFVRAEDKKENVYSGKIILE